MSPDIYGRQTNQLPYACRTASALSTSLASVESETVSAESEYEKHIRHNENLRIRHAQDKFSHGGLSSDGPKYNDNVDSTAPRLALNDQLIHDHESKGDRNVTSPSVMTKSVNKLTKTRGQKNPKALSVLIDGQAFRLDQDTILKAKVVPTSAPPSHPAIFTTPSPKQTKPGKLDILKQKVRSSAKERAPFSAKVQGLAEKARARKAKQGS